MITKTEEYMTASAAARFLRERVPSRWGRVGTKIPWTKQTVLNYVARGLLDAVRVSDQYFLVRRVDVQHLIEHPEVLPHLGRPRIHAKEHL